MLTVASAAKYRTLPLSQPGSSPCHVEMEREPRVKKYTVYKKATENYFIPLTLSRRKSSNYFMMFIGRLTAKYKTLLHFFPSGGAGWSPFLLLDRKPAYMLPSIR